jgi:peptidoglycan/LPS O-acetylase OafA/YrhL
MQPAYVAIKNIVIYLLVSPISFMNPNPNYRPDRDGLRAVAVILVLLFHLRLGIPGGYIGVNVFFVD